MTPAQLTEYGQLIARYRKVETAQPGAAQAEFDALIYFVDDLITAEVERKQAALLELIACEDMPLVRTQSQRERDVAAWTAARRAVLPVGGGG